MIRKPVTT